MAKKNKPYLVSVYVQTEFMINVSAKHKREAIAKAHARVKKKQIPNSAIRKDWTDADEKY